MLPLEEPSPRSVVLRFIDAINRGDVDAILSMGTPDHVFTDSMGQAIDDPESLRRAWSSFFRMVPDYRIEVSESFVERSEVAVFGRAGGNLRVGDEATNNGRWSTWVALRASVAGDRLKSWRVYADLEPVRELLRSSGPPRSRS
jgi:ketosteroid isomerase-like protein